MSKAQFGMIGLGTMGRNFLLNVAEHGFSGAGYDLDAEKRRLLLEEGKGYDLVVGETLDGFLDQLETPRKVMILVPAQVVDVVINQLLEKVAPGDIVIDGGNSHFPDTERREKACAEKSVEFLGVGVSGGEEGARHGASIMIGGKREIYEHVRPILEAASAKVNGESCAAFVGAGSAGHFVKMVHNGIEYGLMQIIAETFDYMLRVLGMDYKAIAETFAAWNGSELNSFLVEITAEVLRKSDAETGRPLVEMVLDKAAQKGTGKWTSQAAMDLGVPIPTIDSAVSMRQISSQKETRGLLAAKFAGLKSPAGLAVDGDSVTSVRQSDMKAAMAPAQAETTASRVTETGGGHGATFGAEKPETPAAAIEELRSALLASFITTYAQGMSMLAVASVDMKYGLDLAEIAKIWRGGCIIRSALLEDMRRAYAANPQLPNLLLDDRFAGLLDGLRPHWREVSAKFAEHRVPSLCLSSTLAYFDAFCSERLPANLIQAQRDFFGAHSYQRVDKEGVFHTPDWNG